MRVRSMILAAVLALGIPAAANAADMAGVPAWAPGCGGLQPMDVYVPPQVAYIVACTLPLPDPTVVFGDPPEPGFFGHLAKVFGHGAPDGPVATVDWRYGNPATHEGKLVYLKEWSVDRPPVHFLVVPK